MFETQNSDQGCKKMVSKKWSKEFLIFWPVLARFWTISSQKSEFLPNIGQKWPKNEKIENSFDHFLETIFLHPWSKF